MSPGLGELATVDVADLTETVSRDRALSQWTGFAELLPEELSAPSAPARLINPDHEVWYQANHLAQGLAPAVGCHFLHDVAIFDHGCRVHDGRMLTDGSSLSPVSLELWRRRKEGSLDRVIAGRSVLRLPYGLVIHDAGYWVHGHWLVDFLPRLAVALELLGDMADFVPLILPHDVPEWALDLIQHVCGLNRDSVFIYDRFRDIVVCDRLCIPNYLYSETYFLHPHFRSIYRPHQRPSKAYGRKFIISRRNFETHTSGGLKRFENRGYLERAAQARGYELVCPETLPIAAQIRLFSDAAAIIGEYGSGLHNSVFSGEGTVVGALRMLNTVQSRIGAVMRQANVYGFPDREWRDDQGGETYCLAANEIDAFIDGVDASLRG